MIYKRDRVSKDLIESAKGMVNLIGSEKIRIDFLNKIHRTEYEYATAEEVERLKQETKTFQFNLTKGILSKSIEDFNVNNLDNDKLTIEEIQSENPVNPINPHTLIAIKHKHRYRIAVQCDEKNKHLAYQEIIIKISNKGLKNYIDRYELVEMQIVYIEGETLNIRI